jgi:hypothetical protein
LQHQQRRKGWKMTELKLLTCEKVIFMIFLGGALTRIGRLKKLGCEVIVIGFVEGLSGFKMFSLKSRKTCRLKLKYTAKNFSFHRKQTDKASVSTENRQTKIQFLLKKSLAISNKHETCLYFC